MAIETTADGGIMITGERDIGLYRLISLKGRLKMELRGMRSRGPSAATIVKNEFGWKGSNKVILEKLEEHIENLKVARAEG